MYDKYAPIKYWGENEWINVSCYGDIPSIPNPVESVFVMNARKMKNARLVVFIVPTLLIFLLLSSFVLKRKLK